MKLKIFIGAILFLIILGIYIYFKEFIDVLGLSQYDKFFDKGFTIIGAILITYTITKIVDLIFKKSFDKFIKHDSLARKFFPLIHKITLAFIWVISVLFTLNLLGININAFLTGAGIGGVIVALAAKEMASNLFGSLSLIFSKNFKIGDRIKIKNFEGVVDEISLSQTRLINLDGNYIYIPNKLIVSETVENLSQLDFKKINISFSLPLTFKSSKIKSIINFIENACEKERKSGKYKNYEIVFGDIDSAGQQIIKILIEVDLDKNIYIIKNELFLMIREKIEAKK